MENPKNAQYNSSQKPVAARRMKPWGRFRWMGCPAVAGLKD